jgi:hypothetical protein
VSVVVLVLLAGLVRYFIYVSNLTGRATAEKSAEWENFIRKSGKLEKGWKEDNAV